MDSKIEGGGLFGDGSSDEDDAQVFYNKEFVNKCKQRF